MCHRVNKSSGCTSEFEVLTCIVLILEEGEGASSVRLIAYLWSGNSSYYAVIPQIHQLYTPSSDLFHSFLYLANDPGERQHYQQ